SEEEDIFWRNNLGEKGYVERNSYHKQPYYPAELFPDAFYNDSCTFSFLKIAGKLEAGSSLGVKSYPRAFGFADNKACVQGEHITPDNPYTPEPEGYGGDAFDLSWAVNEAGEYVELDTADFIKVQTAMYGFSNVVGEISPELRGGRLSSPDPTVTGKNEMLIIENVPDVIDPGVYKLMAYYFKNGRLVENENINWVSSNHDVEISSGGDIIVNEDTYTEVQATAKNGEVVSNTIIIRGKNVVSAKSFHSQGELNIFPNPAHKFINLQGVQDAEVYIYNSNGSLIMSFETYSSRESIDLSALRPGIYFMSVMEKGKFRHIRFTKY
ncbi:MAG: T9SS type A sorting domain-containing protein, partial [Bacteroidota bacterium]